MVSMIMTEESQRTHTPKHVMLGNSFRDADNQWNLGFKSFFNARGRKGGWDENHTGIGSSFLDAFGDVLEDWEIEMGRARLCLQSASSSFQLGHLCM